VTITHATELYNYLSYFETLLTYGSDGAATHLTNAFWYIDDGDLLPCDHTAADAKHKGFITRWNKIKQSKEVQFYGRIYCDICNVPLYVLVGFRMRIKLTKAKPSFYLMKKDAERKRSSSFSTPNFWPTASDPVRRSCWRTIPLSERALSHAII